MRDAQTPIIWIRMPAWAALWRPLNAVIVISKEAERLAEKKALSWRNWRTTNASN